jgi:hypothetical protein
MTPRVVWRWLFAYRCQSRPIGKGLRHWLRGSPWPILTRPLLEQAALSLERIMIKLERRLNGPKLGFELIAPCLRCFLPSLAHRDDCAFAPGVECDLELMYPWPETPVMPLRCAVVVPVPPSFSARAISRT